MKSLRNLLLLTLFLGVVGCISGCNDAKPTTDGGAPAAKDSENEVASNDAEDKTSTTAAPDKIQRKEGEIELNPTRDVYFGNLHVHTSYSFDGYTNACVTGPDDAYKWAKGEEILGGAGGQKLKIKKPLDWYAVSDHSEYLGVFRKMEDPSSPFSKLEIAKEITSDDKAVAFKAFAKVLDDMSAGKSDPQLSDPEVSKTIWQEVVETADKHYQPGKFTTFPAYEWTSNPKFQNMHRVVLFKESAGVPALPFSAMDSDKPEDLWKWMDQLREDGTALVAIPHNANASDGLMFPEEKSYGGSELNKEFALARMRNEPLYEITQIKGTSETHPDLSPNDEFADFELWDYTLNAKATPTKNRVGSFARDAFLRGIKLDSEGKGNPFKYGVIGDSDTHNSAASIEEDNHSGKFGMQVAPSQRLNPKGLAPESQKQMREFSTGGVAGVWAKANTREEIFAAIGRRETFGTSGVRMRVRVFAGYDYSEDLMNADDMLAKAYAMGVPMGGELKPSADGKSPVLLIQAMKEADGANLDRIQVIKGWVKDGKSHEKIYNVALSDGRKADASGKVPGVGNTVDTKAATYTNDIGDAQLSAVWTDPDFDASAHAFYYVRVLEIPTPRWSTYDAATLGVAPPDDVPVSIQERAWSSPIWYTPRK